MTFNLVFKKGQHILKTQRFAAQKTKGRQSYKEHHGSNADYYHIYTDNSLKAHMSALKRFSAYCVQHDIKRLMDITNQDIGNYALYLQNDEGLSAWTVKNHLMTINHLLIGVGLKKEEDAFTATKWNQHHRGANRIHAKKRENIQHNRSQTASQWRSAHSRAYLNHRALIDTERAFGLRQAEVTKVDPAKPSIIADCFFQCQDNLYCFVLKGKGGRPRFATCRQDLKSEMQQLYHFQKLTSLPRNMDQMKKFAVNFGKRHEVNYRKDEYLYHTKIENLKNHINRREYAQIRLRELDHTMKGHGKIRTINGVRDYENRFLQLAQDLGHNRIGILGNYLG